MNLNSQEVLVEEPFVARGRLDESQIPEGHLHFPPDLACESIGPDDPAAALDSRITDFLTAGTRMFWIVFPQTRSVWIFRRDGTAARLTESQSLSGEDVVPGFTCPVAALFADL